MECEHGGDCDKPKEKISLLEPKGKGEKVNWESGEDIFSESDGEVVPILISENILECMVHSWLDANATRLLKECLQEPKGKKRKFFSGK